MLRVTKKGGLCIFDIKNRSNANVDMHYQLHKKRLLTNSGIRKIITFFKNILKIVINRGTPNWYFVIYEVPLFPKVIFDFLDKNNYNYEIIGKKDNGNLIFELNKMDNLKNLQNLIFSVGK